MKQYVVIFSFLFLASPLFSMDSPHIALNRHLNALQEELKKKGIIPHEDFLAFGRKHFSGYGTHLQKSYSSLIQNKEEQAWHLYALYSLQCAKEQERKKQRTKACAIFSFAVGVGSAIIQTLLWTIWKTKAS